VTAALLAALLAAHPAPAEPAGWSGWQQFDYRPNGFGNTAYLFDGSSRRRQGDVASAWVTYDFHYSGRNPTTHVELWEIDCRRRMSRTAKHFVLDGAAVSSPRVPGRALVRIAPRSPEAALAARLCKQT